MLGAKDAQELIGKSLLEFVPRQERQELYERFFRLAQAGKPLPFIEQTIVRPDGSQVELEISATVTQQNGDISVQVMAWDITERKLIQEALHRQAALAEIELAINQPHELQTALDRVANITTRLLPASGGASVALWDEKSSDFWIGSSTILEPMKTLIDRQIRKPDGACHWILNNMRPVITPDVTKDEFGPNLTLTKHHYMAYAGVPLIVEDAALGVLFVFDKHVRYYSQDDLDFLTALANRAALAIAKVRLYDSLQQARASAEETARAKDQFLANMSHELRTPLTAVVSVSELLQQTYLNPVQKEHVHTILASSEKLISLINNILDFSKMEANKLSLEARPFDLHSCIEEALDLVTPEARQKDIELAYSIAEGVQINLLGDAQRLGQVLTNLLNNAVKFTDRGEVTLSVRTRPPTAELPGTNIIDQKFPELLFAVRDSGIGIPADKLDSLFTPFKQLDASTTRKYGGTGLGLAISKQIINQMGGEIWVESNGVYGEGATFYFTIPYQTVTGPLEPYKKKHSPQLMGKQALVVSSGENQRQFLVDQLKYWGMQAFAFKTSQQALTWLQSHAPIDLVLLGIRSPQEGHSILINELYGQSDSSAVPLIVFVSGDELPAINSPIPITACIKTPIKPAKLYNLLMDIFSQPVEHPEVPEVNLSIGTEYPLKTLIAEDDPTSQKVIAMMLTYLGYQPVTASNGLEIIAALEQEPFDVILMDLQMPEMDGISTTRYIRTNLPADQQPYIIALTADARQQARNAMFAMGVDDYLTKPVLAEWLAQALKQASERLHQKSSQKQSSMSIPTPPRSSEGAIDESVLNDLINLIGADAPSALAELFDSFFQTAPALVENLKSAASSQDWTQVKWNAHTLKGNCELLGGTRLAQLCKQLETHASSGNAGDILQKVEQIEVEFVELMAIFTAKRAQL
jgi:signal transduction histidine kinase/CheY-like chemotaxis protein/HPt (histidine-containing phosphotransfer) domain-containing protein